MLLGKVAAVCVLGAVFGFIERLRPSLKGFSKPWRETRTDLAFLFLTPPVTAASRKIAIGIVLILAAKALGISDVRAAVMAGRGPVAGWPAWAQVLGALFAADFAGYWMHRTFHKSRLWPFHAVHHGSEHLNWLSSVRTHPVNDVVQGTVVALFVISLGFPPAVLGAYVPIFVLYALFLHSNTGFAWRGPLRYLLASPLYHRWHHTSQREGLDKNFAGLFPFYDLAFGTFYLPEGRPERFGVAGEPVPGGFLSQLAYPFRGRRPSSDPGSALPARRSF